MTVLLRKWIRSSHAAAIVANWQPLLNRLLWTFILLQFVALLSEWWWPETVRLVEWTLWTVFIIEIFVPRRLIWRIILQAFALLFIQTKIINMSFQSFALSANHTWWENAGALFNTAASNVLLFFPLLWFSLAAWLISNMVIYITRKKMPLYVILIASIVTFCTVDSFTFYILWDRIAIIVACGLLLVINQHFSEFARKNPASWEYVKEYPGTMISFVLVIVSLAMIVGMLAPNVKPLFIDPYTAWKQLRGEQVTPIGKGSSIFLDKIPGEVDSGYRNDDSKLGEGFHFDYSEVMTLNTSFRTYLRGESRTIYTGSGWEKGTFEQFPSLQPIEKEQQLNHDAYGAAERLETFEVNQLITVKGEPKFPVLFGGYPINQLIKIEEEDVLFSFAFWSPHDGVIHWHGWDDYYPRTYQLTSQIPIIDLDEIRLSTTEEIAPQIMEEYLQLPEHLPERIVDLAREVTEDETNVYDQVKAIEQFLSTTYPYTNQPDVSKGSSHDFVDRFLFEIQEGYCDHYSTAMVVMLRSLGIPARWVKGYSSGVLPTDEHLGIIHGGPMMTDPNAGGLYSIRNADSHSWVEVYFDGWGWLPFEPTAGFSMPVVINQDEQASVLPELPPVPEPSEQRLPAPQTASEWPAWMGLAEWGALALITALLIVFAYKLIASYVNRSRMGSKDLPNASLLREYNKLFRYAAKKGYESSMHQTAREMFNAWGTGHIWFQKDLQRCLQYFELAKYSGQTLSPEQLEEATQLIKKIRTEMD